VAAVSAAQMVRTPISQRPTASPMCNPARIWTPISPSSSRSVAAHPIARPGPSKVASSPSPVVLTNRPPTALLPDLPRPTGRRAQAAELAEVVRLYGLRNWVEPGYKHAKGELGWADLHVLLDRAIRRPGGGPPHVSFFWQVLPAEQLLNLSCPIPRPPRRPARSYLMMATSLPLACPSPRYRSASGTAPNRSRRSITVVTGRHARQGLDKRATARVLVEDAPTGTLAWI
jgi:hypothetical protein